MSVLIPVLNEEEHILKVLEGVLHQDYISLGPLEVVVADGMSTDATRAIIQRMMAARPQLLLVDNPERIVPTGLNRALAVAKGELIVRMDGHCEYPPDYVRCVVRLRRETGADNAGGVLMPVGRCYVSRSIAAAYYSPLAAGPALRGERHSEEVREVDSVHGGCWSRDYLSTIGGFDESMVRNQDDELSFRIRKRGGRIVQSSAIRVRYWVRGSYRKLFRQFSQYGYWKVRVMTKHPRQSSWRHILPSLWVVGLAVSGLLGCWWAEFRALFLIFVSGYLLGVMAEGLRQSVPAGLRLWPGIGWSLVMMHSGYGLGFLAGLARRLLGPLPTDALFEKSTR